MIYRDPYKGEACPGPAGESRSGRAGIRSRLGTWRPVVFRQHNWKVRRSLDGRVGKSGFPVKRTANDTNRTAKVRGYSGYEGCGKVGFSSIGTWPEAVALRVVTH